MPIQELNQLLQSSFSPSEFLALAGDLAGDKLSDFIEDTINLPAPLAGVKVSRGSGKGPSVIGIYAVEVPPSTLRAGFRRRRQISSAILGANDHNDALIAFYAPGSQAWRMGFVRGYKYDALESLREFHLGEGVATRTAREQLSHVLGLPGNTELGERSVKLNETFSIEAVSDNFYKQFKEAHFDVIVSKLMDQGESKQHAEDLAVLFTIRIMFLGFVQRKGWLNDDQAFMQNLLKSYEYQPEHSGFYKYWLRTLFFNALNGFGNHITEPNLPDEVRSTFKMLPYLNGGLFQEHEVDKRDYTIPDEQILNFFTFLFSFNFTIEENTLQEQALELNPELLGIIFERLVNKANGAVYTPRTEVDFMCRMSLVKWLQQNLEGEDRPEDRDLFELFFREKGQGKEFNDDQKKGSFSNKQKQTILEKLKTLAICDPAVGSGAFPVGMMHVLNQVSEALGDDYSEQARYERKKRIIGRSLYGVEANEWAVWICQLRLWLSLFIDAPEDLRQSFTPILPSLDFKILHGDSLVQMIGDTLIPVEGHAAIDVSLKRKVTELKKLKADFFNNQLPGNITSQMIRSAEVALAKSIIQEQKKAKIKDLQLLRQKELVTQQSLLGQDEDKVVQQTLGEAEEQEYLREISRMDKMLDELSKRPKTIWSISFAEVFADKGGFDIVIGNPPYIRQEIIADPLGLITDKQAYKNKLAEVINLDYWPSKDFGAFKRISGFNAKSDLFVYFYLHTLKVLNHSGIHTFICSNSWLDVGYGAWMQLFLLNNVQVHGIYDNHARRSFSGADVNTIISIMSAPDKTPKRPYKFVAFKKPFEEVLVTEELLAVEAANSMVRTESHRVFTARSNELLEEGLEDGKYIGNKWGGKYLRAPDVFFSVIARGNLVKLKELVDVKFGIKTGANDFFYLQVIERLGDITRCKNAVGWEGLIESKYLKSVIKSPRECTSILVDPSKLKYQIFVCEQSKADLRGTHALEYIDWGETFEFEIGNKKLNGFHQTESVKGRRLWYKVDGSPGNLFWVKETNDVLATYVAEDPILADCRLYYATGGHNLQQFTNSTLFHLFSETLTRSGLGLGARSLMVYEVGELLSLSRESLDELGKLPTFSPRQLKNIYQECGINPESDTPIEEQEPSPLPDREAVDNAIFDYLGLSEDERKDVYRAVCRLVYNRLSKAESV